MAINVINETVDQLTLKFAKGSVSEMIVIAMSEAIECSLNVEIPLQTAARLREKIKLQVRKQQINLYRRKFIAK